MPMSLGCVKLWPKQERLHNITNSSTDVYNMVRLLMHACFVEFRASVCVGLNRKLFNFVWFNRFWYGLMWRTLHLHKRIWRSSNHNTAHRLTLHRRLQTWLGFVVNVCAKSSSQLFKERMRIMGAWDTYDHHGGSWESAKYCTCVGTVGWGGGCGDGSSRPELISLTIAESDISMRSKDVSELDKESQHCSQAHSLLETDNMVGSET